MSVNELGKLTDYHVEVLRDFKTIETIREAWISMQNHPNADYDFYRAIVQLRPDICYPLVIVIKKKTLIKSIVVCRVENRKMPCKLGYSTIFSSTLKTLVVLYHGILGDKDEEVSRILFNQIKLFIDSREVEALDLEFMDIAGTLYSEYLKTKARYLHDPYYKPQPHYLLQLPESEKDILNHKSSDRRNALYQKVRKMEKTFAERLLFKKYTLPGEIGIINKDAELVAVKSYQRKFGVGFIDNPETEMRLRLWAEKGLLLAYFLYIDACPVAFFIGTVYNDSFIGDYTAFNPEYSDYSPGLVCIIKIVRDIVSSMKNIRLFDFNFGEAPYKKQFSTLCLTETSVLIYSPRIKLLAMWGVRRVIGSINAIILLIIRKFNLELKIKKMIRSA